MGQTWLKNNNSKSVTNKTYEGLCFLTTIDFNFTTQMWKVDLPVLLKVDGRGWEQSELPTNDNFSISVWPRSYPWVIKSASYVLLVLCTLRLPQECCYKASPVDCRAWILVPLGYSRPCYKVVSFLLPFLLKNSEYCLVSILWGWGLRTGFLCLTHT